MGLHHLPLPTEMKQISFWAGMKIGVCPLFFSVPIFGEEKGALPDVLIQAEEKRPVTREKPPLKLEIKEEAPLESVLKTEDEVRFRIPSDIAQSTQFVTGLSSSPYVAVPASNWIVLAWRGEPARVLYPSRELSKIYKGKLSKDSKSGSRWELVVVDSAGRVFKKFGGAGAPPEEVVFDGRSEDGKWLAVGQVYTAVLTYQDGTGRAHTAMDRPFALAGLSLQRPQGFVISLASKPMLDGSGAAGALSAQGIRLLGEAAQIIQRYHPGLSLEVAAYLSRSDAGFAQAAAEACGRELAKRLLLPARAVAARAIPGTADVEERVEVLVLNR